MEVPDEIKRMEEQGKTFTRKEVEAFATCSADIRDRALFVTLYLTNSRVSEIVRRLRKNQIIFMAREGKEDLVFNGLWTEKNPSHPLRTIPIPVEKEKPLVDVLMRYLATVRSDDAVLFPISRQRAWSILKRLCGERCHFLRHTRLSHLVTFYGLNETTLMRMAGWRSRKMVDTYAHFGWEDISAMMRR